MSLKNLNASKKTHKFLLDKLKDNLTLQIYKKFESNLPVKKNFVVAVSGGPDSLALSFLAKIYSIKKSIDIKYFIVDHKLRKNSTLEAKSVQKKLKTFSIKLNILTWKGVKPKKNIQSIAREKRYNLLTDAAKKYKIQNILLGHHLDDLFENFFIRILRGSGLKGLISLDKETHKNQINLIRPLIKIDKKDLIYMSNFIFGSYIKDPSNEDDSFRRVKVRNFLEQLSLEGFDRKKFYTKKNLEDNVTILSKKNNIILKENFFSQSNEVVFRSLTEVIKIVGKKYYAVRGKKIDKVIDLINTKSSFKVTLGGCIIKKVNETVILSKE
ncbi:tRNA lysidine(34) synthetase TilS [Candidatus Pelagibacter bacterium]|nr:tRNA lysidine(34) synthetase TilS [Candidatus Pelagibacter bacterium]